MAAFTSKASGDFNADGQTTWNEVGHPDGADDTAAIGAHAITAAAAVVCGAITVAAGGSLTAAGAANTITSIVMTGASAVTLGATTFAGVLTNSTTGTLTINGACTGITNFTPQLCNQNADVTMTGTLVGPAIERTWTQAGGFDITGFTSDPTRFTGKWGAGPGCHIQANQGSECIIRGYLSYDGSALSSIIIDNAQSYNVHLRPDSGTPLIRHVNLAGRMTCSGPPVTISYVQITPVVAILALNVADTSYGWSALSVDHIWIGSLSTGLLAAGSSATGMRHIKNVAIGYLRDGSASPVTVGISASCSAHIMGCIINATTPVTMHQNTGSVVIDNYGYVDPAMIEAASALAAAVVDPGISKTWCSWGTIERSTTNPRTGTYHTRSTPASIVTTTYPLDTSIYVPIASGQDISVSVWASRSGMTSDCAKVVIDPEQAWFTSVESTELLTNPGLSGTDGATNADPGTTFTSATGGFNAIVTDGVSLLNITSGSAGTVPGQYAITAHTDTTLTLATSPGFSKSSIVFTIANYYELTAAATGARGTGAKGMVRIVLRVDEYAASKYVDWDGLSVTVAGVPLVAGLDYWQAGMPALDASGGSTRCPIFMPGILL